MARKSVRDMWKAKLEGQPGLETAGGRKKTAAPTPILLDLQRAPFSGWVLGVDPSLRSTGLAVLEFARNPQPVLRHHQTVTVKRRVPLPEALAEIHRAITALVERHPLKHVALEQTIYVQNYQTAQILGAARGAAIAAAAVQGLPVFEYPPLRVKQAVVGHGRASKQQLACTVLGLVAQEALPVPLTPDQPDAADAASVALCHAFTWRE